MPDDDVARDVQLWVTALDFIDGIAEWLQLSGWSIGVVERGRLRLHTRGFDPEVVARYAELPLDSWLPGPETVRTGRDQYFPDRESAHRVYPLTADIVGDTRHVAAATLVLWGSRAAAGYLALHFDSPQTFDDEQREQLERLVSSIASVIPPEVMPEVLRGPTQLDTTGPHVQPPSAMVVAMQRA